MSDAATAEIDVDVFREMAKIKGDAIGDTLFSERWVLRVLIKLSELKDESWDADFEQMLCALWDMTAEKDVVHFLLSNDMYDVFCRVIRTVSNARCIEIMAGILGNMCCVDEARVALAEHNASLIVINLITSQDSLVLVQVVRLLNSCLWPLRAEDPDAVTRPSTPTFSPNKECVSGSTTVAIDNSMNKTDIHPWLTIITCEKDVILNHLMFFLSSAINEELLCSTLELLDTILAIPSLRLGPVVSTSPDMASGLAECLRQLLKDLRVGDSVTSNRRLWRAIQVWIGLVGHVASCQHGRVNLSAAGDILTKCFTKLVILLTTPEALKTQEPEMATLCLCVLETLPEISVTSSVLARLTTVLFKLNQDIEEMTQDVEETLEVRNLLHRGLQFLKKRIEESDDLTSYLGILSQPLHAFILMIVGEDRTLLDKINRALLQNRTNGLVQ